MTRDGELPREALEAVGSDPAQSVDSVADWLDAIAAEEGVSRDGLLDDLLGSYWTLKEVITLLEQDPAVTDRSTDVGDYGTPSASLLDGLDDVRDRLGTLESAHETLAAEAASDADVRALDAERSAALTAVTARQASFEDRVESEFEHARALFEHLLAAEAASEQRLDDLAARLDALRDRQAERSGVERLRAAARRAGVERVRCEGCGTPVAVDDLTRPGCPACDRDAAAIEPPGGWLGLGPGRLVVHEGTERSTAAPEAEASGPADPAVADVGPPASEPEGHEPVEIEWVLPSDGEQSADDEGPGAEDVA